MSRSQNTPLLLALVVCILVVAGVMIAAVFLAAGQKPVVVVLPPAAGQIAPAPAPDATAPAEPAAAGAPSAPAAKPAEVTVARVAAVPALANVFDPSWDKVPPVEIPMLPQQTASPMLETATITTVQVQAARDDKRIAWRISWAAAHPATSVETGHFADAVALQVPLVDGAPFTMGAKGQPVRMLHWKALWQVDIDTGFQDILRLYPNAWTDLYWFAPKTGPVPATQIVKDPKSEQFFPAHAAGNPMANVERKYPLEELTAEGFGSATTVPNSPSNARGVWKDGRWTVIIDRPISPDDDPVSARLQSAGQNMISFAVWDGSAGNRGGQKHYCAWVPMKVEP